MSVVTVRENRVLLLINNVAISLPKMAANNISLQYTATESGARSLAKCRSMRHPRARDRASVRGEKKATPWKQRPGAAETETRRGRARKKSR